MYRKSVIRQQNSIFVFFREGFIILQVCSSTDMEFCLLNLKYNLMPYRLDLQNKTEFALYIWISVVK